MTTPNTPAALLALLPTRNPDPLSALGHALATTAALEHAFDLGRRVDAP